MKHWGPGERRMSSSHWAMEEILRKALLRKLEASFQKQTQFTYLTIKYAVVYIYMKNTLKLLKDTKFDVDK